MNKQTVTADKLLENIKNGESIFILDVRDVEKYQAGTVEIKGIQTENIPYVAMADKMETVKERMAQLPPGAEIVTVCTTGNKAQKAASLLCELGFTAVALEGGLTAWREQHDRNQSTEKPV